MIFTLLSQTNKVCKPFSLTELYHKSLQMQGGLFYGIFQQRSWCFADSRGGPGRRSWYLGRYQPSGRLWPGQPCFQCSCMIEKHQQNRQRQPPYRYSEQKGLVEMLTAVCYTKYDLSSGELAWKSPIRRFAYQKYFSRNFLFFCKIFSRIHSTWVRQERTVM